MISRSPNENYVPICGGDGAIDADYKLYYYGDGPDAGDTPVEKCVITLFEDMFPDWNDILVILSYF